MMGGMTRIRLVFAAMVLLAGAVACDPAAEGYVVVWEDGFAGPGLDPAKWENNAPWLPEPAPGAVEVSGGSLWLRTGDFNGWVASDVSSMGQRSHPDSQLEPDYPNPNTWTHGYFEARFRYTDSPWAWPAFWLFSAYKSEQWPLEGPCPPEGEYTAEWDIVENGIEVWAGRFAGDAFFTNEHENTQNGQVLWCGQADVDDPYGVAFPGASDWHTWYGRWTPNELCVGVDQQEQWLRCSAPFATMDQPMHLILDMNVQGGCTGTQPAPVGMTYCGPRPSVLELQVDYVKVWQLPGPPTTEPTTTKPPKCRPRPC